MHQATPLNTSFRSYSAGGARSTVASVNDKPFMQEMGGNFMKNETRDKIESPQNYGFTSVTMDGEKGQDGKLRGPETFITFVGGNRSFPVATAIDDRRHRLHKLEKGDVAMFRTRDDQQQFHLTRDGGFWSAPDDKTVRMQLVPKKQQQQSSAPTAHEGIGAEAGVSQQQQQMGQEAVAKDGKDSHHYVDVGANATRMSHKNDARILVNGTVLVHCIDGEVYLGAEKGKASFGKVETNAGTSVNVYAKIG